jgi:hypothetical protein
MTLTSMAHPELVKVFKLVEERTGYPVSVVGEPSLTTMSAMQSATAATNVHLVQINPKHEKVANYLVALQCAMLLVKWHDPERIPDFVLNGEKVRYLEGKVASGMRRMKLPESAVARVASSLIQGLLLQLNSVPASILAAEWCHAECHGLRQEQETAMLQELRQASASLAPSVRTHTPADIFDRSIAMNAAYALWWTETSGDRLGLLPYQVTGYLKKGEELLTAMKKIPEDMLVKHPDTVDAWAEILHMQGWYEWHFRKA